MGPAIHVAAHKSQRADSSTPAALRQLWRNVRALRLADAREGLQAAEKALLLEDTASAHESYANLLALHAATLILEDDTLSGAAAAEQALRRGAAGRFARLARLAQRFCAWKAGLAPASTLNSPRFAPETASLRQSVPPGDTLLADVLDLTLTAAIDFSLLRVTSAERLARDALRLANAASFEPTAPVVLLARIFYEQGRTQEAQELLGPRMPIIRTLGSLDCVEHAYSVLAKVNALRGEYQAASTLLEEACEVALTRNWPRLLAVMLAERIRMCQPGDEKRAASLLRQLRNLFERHRPTARCARSAIAAHLCKAQIYAFLKYRTPASPRTAVTYLRNDARLNQDLHSLAWVDLAEAQILWQEGDRDKSLGLLARALRTAQTTGLWQDLSEAEPLMRSMIARFLESGAVEPDLLASAIGLVRRMCRSDSYAEQRRGRTARSSDGLTTREQDILQLMCEGRTNKMIARAQGVAPETIKTHVKNIFAKLGVNCRLQAVVKAEQIGLVTPLGTAILGRHSSAFCSVVSQ